MHHRLALLLVLSFTLVPGSGTRGTVMAQDGAASQSTAQRPSFGAEATAVVVDVVVRDKQGRPVTDLTEKDFELYEDNVRQEIGTLTLVAPGRESDAAEGAAATGGGADGGPTGPTFLAIVLDKLSPEGRALAQKGALAYLETARPTDFAGVFSIDQALRTLQTYTNDRDKLRAAIEAAGTTAFAPARPGEGRPGSTVGGSTDPRTPVTAGAEFQGSGAVAGTAPVDGDPTALASTRSADAGRIAGMLAARMERSYDTMMRDQQGAATTSGLLALVDSLGTLPGRKTVVYFAEGIAIPPAVQAQFESVITTANRANVSVYTVDAAGLRVHSRGTETAEQLKVLGQAGVGDIERDSNSAYMRDLEQNEDILRDDPSVGLTVLAERTGGFTIRNTNDLQRGFQQIDADRRFHYLLTYTPKNTDFGGEFRRIQVKVPSRNVAVRARNGYVAVRAAGGPIMSYEGPVLAALDRSPAPSELPVLAGAFSFPDPKSPGQVALLVRTEPGALTFQTDTRKKTFQTDFAILARIRSAQGEVVQKVSQPYRLNGPSDQVENAKRGEILFFRQPALAPGAYTLEYVVYDALGKKAGAGTEPFTVFDKPGQTLQASSLLIVQRTERVPPSERAGDNPLYQGDLLLYPNLGTPLKKSVDKTVSFAITVHAPGGAAPSATLVLHKDGAPLGQVPLTLGAPDASGRIQFASQLPLDNFPPGKYTLELNVSRGQEKEVRKADFTLTE